MKLFNSEINIYKGSVVYLNVDAIVNAANSTLLGGGGVDGAIHEAAGIELFNECKKLNGCKTGEAKITKGYKLPAKNVIHTVGPIYFSDKTPAISLKNCYINSLNVLMKNNLHSIGFCCISTGVYGYPLDAASKIAVDSVIEWIKENKDYPINVVFACYSDREFQIYSKLL